MLSFVVFFNCFIYCERRWAKRSELAVKSLLLRSHMWTQNNAYLANIDYRHIVRRPKKSLFSYVETISATNWPGPTRPGPARPWRYLMAYFSNTLKDTKVKLPHIMVSGLKIVLSNVSGDIFGNSKVAAFLAKTDFCHFYICFCV